jgi:hypothetical protein
MSNLKSLKTITALSFLPDDVKNGIDEFSSFGVVTFGPIVSCTGLTKDEVIRSEELAKRPSSDRVHGTRLKIH